MATLVGKARAEAAPVIWVPHSDDDNLPRDSDGWQYVPEVTPEESESLIHKRYPDSFDATDLEAVLAERQVGHLIVTGAQTDARASARRCRTRALPDGAEPRFPPNRSTSASSHRPDVWPQTRESRLLAPEAPVAAVRSR
ncbi:MAG: isochorismatase family protein, partial [Micromonosporaceae bacterium]